MSRSSLVLVLNAGSSSLKYQVIDGDSGAVVVRGLVERVGGADVGHDDALHQMYDDLEARRLGTGTLLAVGHRVVHGGPRLSEAVLIDERVIEEINSAARLAPLHNGPELEGIRSTLQRFADLPQVAVFDTAYFADLPAAAATYAIDVDVAARAGIRRYGAHGTSHAYVAGTVASYLERPLAELDQIVLHLGNGASASAVSGGRPVDTSMGLTPLEGLVMGTRSGDLDPGVLLHLMRYGGLDVDALDDLLHHHSGLQGMAAISDVRDLLSAVDAGDPRARTAYEVYCHRIKKYVGAYLAVLGGADVLSFTAGVGEHSHRVRADVLDGLGRLGLVLDPERNAAPVAGIRRISTDASPITVLVVPTNEELMIARQVVSLLGGGPARPA